MTKIYDPKTRLFYQLIYENPEHPILEISGIRMQEGDAVETAKLKVGLLNVRKNMKILETCTGLAYCTYELVKKAGDNNITSIEVDKNVLYLAENYTNHYPRIKGKFEQIRGDSYLIVKKMVERGVKYDRILHDPPRFSRAPLLYSQEFYNNTHKLLKDEGIMVHYIGNPYSKFRKKNFVGGIIRRLKIAGYKKVIHKGYNLIVKK